MFSLSSRFTEVPGVLRLAQNDLPGLAERFYRIASGELDHFEGSYRGIGMAEVQTAFLLAH